jgi:hypothetical protein
MKFTVTAAVATMLVAIALTETRAQGLPELDARFRSARNSAERHQAPIGHRQPRRQDLPPDVREKEGMVSARQRDFDRSLNICRGC